MRIKNCFTMIAISSAMAFAVVPPLSAQATITISTSPVGSLPSRSHFAGMNLDLANSATSYNDTKMQGFANQLALGWVRFPGGTSDDSYNYSDGEMDWVSSFQQPPNGKGSPSTSVYNGMVDESKIILGKKSATPGKTGIQISDFHSFLKTQTTSYPHVIGVINTFTDVNGAGIIQQMAKTDGIPVDVWELGNEPSYFTTDTSLGQSNFWADASDYLTTINKNYASQISGSAPLAVWVDPSPGSKWDVSMQSWLATKGNAPFWQQIYSHSYPQIGGTNLNAPDVYNFYNGHLDGLFHQVDVDIEGLFTKSGYTFPIEWSEYNLNDEGYKDTLYNAVYITEFATRLSTDLNVTHVGMHMAVGPGSQEQTAIGVGDDHTSQVEGDDSDPIDTTTLNFEYYMKPAGMAMQVVNPIINGSTSIYTTGVTGDVQISYTTVYQGTQYSMDSLYAVAYLVGGHYHVVITNKDTSNNSQTVKIKQNNAIVNQAFTTTTVTGSTPNAVNTYGNPGVTSTTVTLPVGTTITVPSSSIVDVTW